MPYRFFRTSKTEPMRTILFTLSVLTAAAQIATLLPWITSPWYIGLPNVLIVVPVCIWAAVAAFKNNLKQMGRSSFALCLMWTWSGLARLFSIQVLTLVWVPYLLVGIVFATGYLYFSYQRRRNGDID